MKTDSLFDRIFATAPDYIGTDAELAAVVDGPGAIWLDPVMGRALVMDSITGWALRNAKERIVIMVQTGTLARDRMPLSEEIDIYTSPRKAAL